MATPDVSPRHTRRQLGRGALPALLMVAVACGSPRHETGNPGGGPDPEPGLTPVPTERGTPLEPQTSKTISSEGGTFSSADGKLSISIPAGAVSAPTEFTITPIATTARGGVGGAFRLGPEGTTFAVPLTLTFVGLDDYPYGASIEDIGVEYQDSKGFWQRVEPAIRDAGANTVSVPADHFSDWTIVWQTGIPVAEGPIRIVQSVGIPFDAQGRATVYLWNDSDTFTSYVLAGTLTVPETIPVGGDVCVPAQATSAWANVAEVQKARGVFRWGAGASWTLACTEPGGTTSTQTLPASFDTMGISLSHCVGAYDPDQIAELDFLQGAYTTDCGLQGTVRGTWSLSGYQILVDPTSGLTTTEAGGTATFQITLNRAPAADVVVPLSSNDPTEGAVSASVTFTPANWSTPQVVTITGVNDSLDEGDVPYTILTGAATSADPHYAGIDPADVTATNLDDDAAGLVVSPTTGLVTTEGGGTATFQVTLASEPLADVVVALSSTDTTEGTVAPASATFTPANWNVAQTFTVTGVNDPADDGDAAYSITVSSSSADPLYVGLAGAVETTNLDDETAGLLATPSAGLITTEVGGTASYQLTLGSQPLADVVVSLSSSDTTEGTVGPASITFTAANWDVAQTVTVTGVDDLAVDGQVAYTVQMLATSTDASYVGVTGTVSITNTDNDVAGITVGTPSATSTSEAGTTATFTIVLSSQPTADVTIPLSSTDTTAGTVSPASVVFTSASWNVPQTVTITGVDDLVADGPQTYGVAIGPATSLDAAYGGTDPADLTFTNTDNDAAGITVGTPSATSTSEAGTTATFTIVLSSQPTADVTIPLSSTDTTEGTVSSASVAFTAANWNVAQTVTVTGADDVVADGPQTYVVVIGPATSLDAAYSGNDPADLPFTNTDNDTAGIDVGLPSDLFTSETGTSVTFTLVLTSEPTSAVTIPLSSSDITAGTITPASVTFSTADWSAPQTVTVTGVDDLVADGAQLYSAVIGASTSLDPSYQLLDPADVLLTNIDDDSPGQLMAFPSSGLVTTEAGGTATFQVTLSSAPLGDVVVSLSSSSLAEGTVAPAGVTFTPANWNVAQTVAVTGVDDAVVDGAAPYSVQLSATSTDPAYAAAVAAVSVTNLDNDL